MASSFWAISPYASSQVMGWNLPSPRFPTRRRGVRIRSSR